MKPGCPEPEELLSFAIGEANGSGHAATARHVEACDECASRVHEYRQLSVAIHSLSETGRSEACLDEDAIAALSDGILSGDRHEIDHISTCAHCRSRLAAVARLTDDSAVSSEIRAVLEPKAATRQLPQRFVLAGLAAAAVAAIVFAGPIRSALDAGRGETGEPQHRESAITAAPAPRIVSRGDFVTPADSVRWTSVPDADLYRVRIWSADGSVIWSADTRDTTAGLPPVLDPGVAYAWDVSARTGWDRWVTSDLVDFTLSAHPLR